MDIRRIDLTPRSLERPRPNLRKLGRRALPFVLPIVPVGFIVTTLQPQASPASAQFAANDLSQAALTLPIHAAMYDASLRIAAVNGLSPALASPPPAPIVTPTAPNEPIAPQPDVDTSSAAAWAASPGVACIRQAESGDNYGENTGNGYYGAYQDSLSTWEGAGGTGLPSDAPPAVQDQINYQIYLSGGWGQWSTAAGCGL